MANKRVVAGLVIGAAGGAIASLPMTSLAVTVAAVAGMAAFGAAAAAAGRLPEVVMSAGGALTLLAASAQLIRDDPTAGLTMAFGTLAGLVVGFLAGVLLRITARFWGVPFGRPINGPPRP